MVRQEHMGFYNNNSHVSVSATAWVYDGAYFSCLYVSDRNDYDSGKERKPSRNIIIVFKPGTIVLFTSWVKVPYPLALPPTMIVRFLVWLFWSGQFSFQAILDVRIVSLGVECMTTGQLVFCSGIGLLILTIILACIFWLKKPQYIPGNVALDGMGIPKTRKLRSSYPTDRLTVRKNEKPAVDCETADLQERTEQRKEDCCKMVYGVEVLPDDGRKEDQKTEELVSSTSRLTVEVSSLDTAIAAAIAPTEKLLNTVLPAQHQTEPLETLPSEATDLLTHQDDNPNTKA